MATRVSNAQKDGFGKASDDDAKCSQTYYCAEQVWDLNKEWYGRNGWDNKGSNIDLYCMKN